MKKTVKKKAPAVPKEMTLAELNAATSRFVHLKTSIHNGAQELNIPVRYLRADEMEQLQVMLAEVVPPLKGDEYDFNAPEYVKKMGLHQRFVRSQALWWACPFYEAGAAAAGKAVVGPAAIHEFVRAQLTERIQEELYAIARNQESEEVEGRQLSFT